MEIYAYGMTERAASLGVASPTSAQLERTGTSTAGSFGGRPTGLPMLGACAAPVQMSVWQRLSTDAHTHVPTTIKRNAAAGVRPGLRSTSPPV